MIELLRNFFGLDKKGQDLTEYALLVALIAIVVLVAVVVFGDAVSTFFQSLGDVVSTWIVGGGT